MLIQLLMSLFVVFALSRAYLQFRAHNTSLTAFIFWILLWSSSLVVVFWPHLIDYLSNFLGIQRSIDVLVYFGIIFLFYLIFRSYIKIQEMEREITELTRSIALSPLKKDK